jgi:hypothetical protein
MFLEMDSIDFVKLVKLFKKSTYNDKIIHLKWMF